MKIRYALLVALLLPVALAGQEVSSDQRDAVIAALKHFRKELPAGPIALQMEGLPNEGDALPVAAAVGAQAKPRTEIARCDGGKCRLNGVVGGLIASDLSQRSSDHITMTITTMVEEGIADRQWISARGYTVQLRKTGGSWEVVSTELRRRS